MIHRYLTYKNMEVYLDTFVKLYPDLILNTIFPFVIQGITICFIVSYTDIYGIFLIFLET